MLKLTTAALTCLFTSHLFAQDLKNPDLQSLVKTERAFAKLATDQNIRTAFLTYLADSSVTFGGGIPQNGRKQFEASQDQGSLLTWEPIYSEISASGDFGFNTGPWQFKTKRTDSIPVAYGDFVSVWQKESNGNWKLYLDLGVRHPSPPPVNATLTTTSQPLSKPVKGKREDFEKELKTTELKFQQDFDNHGCAVYGNYKLDGARFFRTGRQPAITKQQVDEILKDQQNTMLVKYKPQGFFVSPAGDMGCVYGVVEVVLKNATDNNTHRACYQRIWKKDGANWKIAIDVIGVN